MNFNRSFHFSWSKILLLILLFFIPMPGVAANKKKKSKHPTFTHRYTDVPLSTVLSDLSRKTDYEILYNEDEIDLGKRITATFKDASARSVLKKVLDKDLECKSRKSTITIVRKPSPPIEYKVTATAPSSIDEDSLRVITTYTDTVFAVKCHNQTVSAGNKQTEPELSAKGHYIEALVGLGHSGSTLQAQYAYFFHENWGVYAGVGFSGTTVSQKASDKTFSGVLDSDGEKYDHTVTVNNWKDRYATHTVDIPLGVEFQYPFNNKLGLYAALGAKIGFPVYNCYQTVSGTAVHSGTYAYSTHATIVGSDFEDRDFYTLRAAETESGKSAHKISMPVVAAMVTADLGLSFPVSEQISILTGLYAQVTCNDQRTVKDAAMGWSRGNEHQYQHTFMTYPEAGVASTEQGKALLPYQVGVKIGVRWHHKPKSKPIPMYEVIQVCDTTYTLSLRTDTVLKPQTESAREIKEIMRRSVIWFDLDKTEPKLQPADILTQIAAILKANPDQHILVNGHASREGNERHNRRLSENRAKAVYDLLIKEGVPASQMKMNAFSADVDFVEENATAAGHNISLDRRVEIIPVVEPDKH